MKVTIRNEESYGTRVFPYEPIPEYPDMWLPVEIPDELWTEYEAARAAVRDVTARIIVGHGMSEYNQSYPEEWQAMLDRERGERSEVTEENLEAAWAKLEQWEKP